MSSFQKGCVHLFYSQEGRDKLSLSWAKALQFTVKHRAEFSRQAIEYDYNNKNKSKKQFQTWSQNWLPPCNNFPLSKPIPQSCGKREWQPFCLVRWIFLGLSTIFASVSSVEICLLFDPLLESVYFTPVDLETLNFKSMRQDLKKFSAFLQMGKGKSQGSLKLFPWYVSQPSGACNPAFWVSSGFTIGSGWSGMTARWQVFPFLGAHWFTLKGCNHWFHSSGLPFLAMNGHYLGDISWSTFVSSAGRLIPVQSNILDMALQVLSFGPGPINN